MDTEAKQVKSRPGNPTQMVLRLPNNPGRNKSFRKILGKHSKTQKPLMLPYIVSAYIIPPFDLRI